MHLLAAQPGQIVDGSEAVDLGQSPGEIVFISAADTELACLADLRAGMDDEFPTLRLANLMSLSHNMSVDHYVDAVIQHAKLVIVRCLGGAGYWPYGIERIAETCRNRNIVLALLPGDDQPDATLDSFSTLKHEARHRLWQYRIHGGVENDRNFLRFAATLIGHTTDWNPPRQLLRAGLYWPDLETPDISALRDVWRNAAPVAVVTFYKALVQAGTLAPIDALIDALSVRGVNPLPIYISSLKDPVSVELLTSICEEIAPSIVLNATGFAVSQPGAPRTETAFDTMGCPVLQIVLGGSTHASWESNVQGLSPKDLAMNVVLPEVDGRILARAISFKSEARYDPKTEISVAYHETVPDRVDFTANLAARWVRLSQTPAQDRRIAIVLANYPNKDGRLGNGVGLDTPASAINVLNSLAHHDYTVDGIPSDGNALMQKLSAGPTNALDRRHQRKGGVRLSQLEYQTHFDTLPESVRHKVSKRWGAPATDPFVIGADFLLPVLELGNIVVAIQPARGYNIDPAESYHDPDLVPPHGYIAFYAWLRKSYDAHAVIHLGKHGNLEWLPGKAVALSEDCFPEAVFGAMPHLYPFIVNDPGEGAQAKRRTSAVIIDHLTPPLTRAESYGPLKDLEALVDEYYEAAGIDPRRIELLRTQILDLAQATGLDKDTGMVAEEEPESALAKLDNYLCELKEMQIRNGLHVFGDSPDGTLRNDLLVALTRIPRNAGAAGDASLIRALATDLQLADFDPLDCEMAADWMGLRPDALNLGEDTWRSAGDTVERLEALALRLVRGDAVPAAHWQHTLDVLTEIQEQVAPSVDQSGRAEIEAILTGLDGKFVIPGPSGAPTRGRLDVLPTGRNFYSVDNRTVPTPAAWLLGWKSADLLIAHHRQTQGAWPRTIVLSAWGTSNMRTGGEDIAQALALMGVRPQWDNASRRVTGFEILPLDTLDRPRVDVTLRISGFFRDAFPAQIDLFDSAVRDVAALDESEANNPLAAQTRIEQERLIADGVDESIAAKRAGHRIFGSKPGSYGAGLQALIDERGWESEGDLARAYIAWGGYAYGGGAEGTAEHRLFEERLSRVEAVVHNQDNREHDLLDSDDYYQFEGGATTAVRHLSGHQPAIYHNDHSRPESPRIRTLEDEIGRVVRARVVNPKWISGVMRHGYKGAFEMAATVDYLFAFAATARVVQDHHFDLVYDAYLGDNEVRQFLIDNNPAAAKEIAERLIEAQERGLWKPRSNAGRALLEELADDNLRAVS
jgi:cobaltochelatase CobN